jgi:hypothetical protein
MTEYKTPTLCYACGEIAIGVRTFHPNEIPDRGLTRPACTRHADPTRTPAHAIRIRWFDEAGAEVARTYTYAEAGAEIQRALDAKRYGGVHKLVDELLYATRQDDSGLEDVASIERLPMRDGMRDPLIDRIEILNLAIKTARDRLRPTHVRISAPSKLDGMTACGAPRTAEDVHLRTALAAGGLERVGCGMCRAIIVRLRDDDSRGAIIAALRGGAR